MKHKTVFSKGGFSLVEMLVMVGIMSIVLLAMMTMQDNQTKSNNYLDFKLKTIQLRGTLIGQFLKDANNCACLFNGAPPFPAAGTNQLGGAAPTDVGLYTSAAPACGAPASYFINAAGVDGVAAKSVSLQNIKTTTIPNIYSGDFVVNATSTKAVLGPKDITVSVPVSISTTPVGANAQFTDCSVTTTTSDCVTVTTPMTNFCATAICPVDHPKAVSGQCSASCHWIQETTLSADRQYCGVIQGNCTGTAPGDGICIYGGQRATSATVVCCK